MNSEKMPPGIKPKTKQKNNNDSKTLANLIGYSDDSDQNDSESSDCEKASPDKQSLTDSDSKKSPKNPEDGPTSENSNSQITLHKKTKTRKRDFENKDDTVKKKAEEIVMNFKAFADFDNLPKPKKPAECTKIVDKKRKPSPQPVSEESKKKSKVSVEKKTIPVPPGIIRYKYEKPSSTSTIATPKEIWTKVSDENTGKFYYWNPLTDKTAWKDPTKTKKATPQEEKQSPTKNGSILNNANGLISNEKRKKISFGFTKASEATQEEEKMSNERNSRKLDPKAVAIERITLQIRRLFKRISNSSIESEKKRRFLELKTAFETRRKDWKKKELNSRYFLKRAQKNLEDLEDFHVKIKRGKRGGWDN